MAATGSWPRVPHSKREGAEAEPVPETIDSTTSWVMKQASWIVNRAATSWTNGSPDRLATPEWPLRTRERPMTNMPSRTAAAIAPSAVLATTGK